MKFLYPEFLWALLAIAIPIAVHLFNFRKFKKVEFSSIAFLKEVEFQTQKQSKLKHLILLLIRIIAITFLVFAFAQPYIPTGEDNKALSNIVSVYIDNSYSMDTKGENGYLLELAKEQAISIANEYAPSDEFIVLTNDFEGKHQRAVNREQFIKMVEDIHPGFSSKKLSEIAPRIHDLMKNSTSKKASFWLSDFQVNTSDFKAIHPDSTIAYSLVPYPQEGKGNIYIDSVWFDTPIRTLNKEDEISIHIVNDYEQEITAKVNLEINNKIEGFANFTIAPKSDYSGSITFKVSEKGWQNAKVYLSDYPNPDMLFDDSFYFTYRILDRVNILYLHDKFQNPRDTAFITNLFNADSLFNISNIDINQFDFNQIGKYNFVILNHISNFTSGLDATLQSFIDDGGSVLLFPEKYSPIQNEFLQQFKIALSPKDSVDQKVGEINTEHPIYQSVFEKIPHNINLPVAYEHFPIQIFNASNADPILTFQSGEPFLVACKEGKGNLYLCASPLTQSATNLMKHAIYVPTVIRMAEFSQPVNKIYYTIGNDQSVEIQTGNIDVQPEDMTIKEVSSDFSFIPEVNQNLSGLTLKLYNQVKDAGFYIVNSKQENIAQLAFNYSRSESDWKFYNYSQLENELNNTDLGIHTQIITGADGSQPVSVSNIVSGEKYWRICIIIVLILLAIEIALFRLWKN